MEKKKAGPTGVQASTAYDYLFKIIIIGDPCCGKTSLLIRSTQNKRNDTYETTIGVDCKSKTMKVKNKVVKLQIWDTAGQERFRTLTTAYYRGTHCCILVFDITNEESFYHLYQWIDQYTYYCDWPIKNIIIAGNKHDLEAERKVSRLEIDEFVSSMGCEYVEISVKENIGIDNLISKVIEKSFELYNYMEQQKKLGNGEAPTTETTGQDVNIQLNRRATVDNVEPVQIRLRKRKNQCCAA